jgi:hypothetical protein
VICRHSIVAENRCLVHVYAVMFDSGRFQAIAVDTRSGVPRSRDPKRVGLAMEKTGTLQRSVAVASAQSNARRNKETVQVPSQCVFVCPGGLVETRVVAGQMRQARL